MKGLFKLLARYIFGGESIFFIIFFPLILLSIMGTATIFTSITPFNQQTKVATSFVTGISITQIIASGMFLIPITIVDFKNSVLMKRIGATNIKPWQFLMIVLCLFIVQSTFSFFYVRVIATLLYGWRLDYWNFAFPFYMWKGYLWSLLTMAVAISFALVIASFSKTVRQAATISNLVYFPVSILSGGFVPINLVYGSTFLKYLNYINPFRYSLEPYFQSQQAFVNAHYQLTTWEWYIFPIISLIIMGLCIFIASRKLKWTT